MSQESDPDPPSRATDAILVVKGAGLHRHLDTLDQFARGFYPAVRTLDPTARLTSGVDPDLEGGEGSDQPSAGDAESLHITTRNRRILLREVDWESAIGHRSALATLRGEWQIASFALLGRASEAHYPAGARQRFPWLVALDRVTGILWRAFLIYLVSLLAIHDPASAFLPGWTLISALAAAVIVAQPAWLVELDHIRGEAAGSPAAARAPLSASLLLMLTLILFLHPGRYLLIFAVLLALTAAALAYAAIRWSPAAGATDTREQGARHLRLITETGLVYRLSVIMSLPIVSLALALAHLLHWIPATRGIGRSLAGGATRVISGVMGDVVTYAMDAARAARIRRTFEDELRRLQADERITAIHVVAHSQGTALTFESLYDPLGPASRDKLKTYLTMGSPLGLYHLIQAAFDPEQPPRFPPEHYPDFEPGYRWFNIWSFTDPITEFSGLEAYRRPAGKAGTAAAHPAGPIDIKAGFAPARNHSEYWHDARLVHLPLARRILEDVVPDAWQPAPPTEGQPDAPGPRRKALAGLAWLSVIVLLCALAWAWGSAIQPILQGLWQNLASPAIDASGPNTARYAALGARLGPALQLLLAIAFLYSLIASWLRLPARLAGQKHPRPTAAATQGVEDDPA